MHAFQIGCSVSQQITASQNEPENSNPTYPTAIVTASQEAQIATALRTLMNNNGFSGTRIIGYDHNWNDAGGYPVQIVSISWPLWRTQPPGLHRRTDARASLDATGPERVRRRRIPLLLRQCRPAGHVP